MEPTPTPTDGETTKLLQPKEEEPKDDEVADDQSPVTTGEAE